MICTTSRTDRDSSWPLLVVRHVPTTGRRELPGPRNGRTEGVNTRTKMIKRQMYGRAGFALPRHRILLG
jgi:hypothetical protein